MPKAAAIAICAANTAWWLGVENLVVVETDDAVLIADRSKAQEIKTVVKQLEVAGSPEGKAHRKIYRPWGITPASPKETAGR